MNRNKRHGISLFANKNLEENLFLIKSNLSSTKTFLKAYSDYPSSNVTTIQYEDNNKTTFYDTQRRQQPERKRRKTYEKTDKTHRFLTPGAHSCGVCPVSPHLYGIGSALHRLRVLPFREVLHGTDPGYADRKPADRHR